MTTATHNAHETTTEHVLFVVFELSEKTWKLGFTTGHGQKPRERSMEACNQAHCCLWWGVYVEGVGGADSEANARRRRMQGFKSASHAQRFLSAHHKTHTHRGLVPIFSWYLQALWKRCGIKHIAHDAVSSCLVSPSLS